MGSTTTYFDWFVTYPLVTKVTTVTLPVYPLQHSLEKSTICSLEPAIENNIFNSSDGSYKPHYRTSLPLHLVFFGNFLRLWWHGFGPFRSSPSINDIYICLLSHTYGIGYQVRVQEGVEDSGKYPIVVSTWPFLEAVRAAWEAVDKGFNAVDAVVEGCSACEELRCDGTGW